jgi:molybdopterin converting factor subunit 1
MRVNVLLFARLREIAGQSALSCDVADEATIADVWQAVALRHPGLAPFGGNVSCARNEDFARLQTRVAADDEVAFLPPVSGGAVNRS